MIRKCVIIAEMILTRVVIIWRCIILGLVLASSQVGYREKARAEAGRGGSLVHRPDIALATEVSKLTSQVPAALLRLLGHRMYRM